MHATRTNKRKKRPANLNLSEQIPVNARSVAATNFKGFIVPTTKGLATLTHAEDVAFLVLSGCCADCAAAARKKSSRTGCA